MMKLGQVARDQKKSRTTFSSVRVAPLQVLGYGFFFCRCWGSLNDELTATFHTVVNSQSG